MDHAITEITWQVTGQSDLQVNINNRIAEITFSPGWTGIERLVFTATDPDGLTSSTTVSFDVNHLYLYLSMPESAIESAGKIQGAVYVKKKLSSDLQINLTSSDTTEIQVPATVTIVAGHSSVDFDCTVINDTDSDGAQGIYIRATADGCDSAGHEITIRDDEVSADTLVAEGRQFLSNHTHDDIINAHSAFESAISKDANHSEANFFIAVTRLLNLLNTDELNNLLSSYDISETGRDIYNWTADFQRDSHGDIELPENSPTFDTIQTYLLNHLIPEIDAAQANLSKIYSSFTTIITNDESGDYLDEAVEIDYGDILAFRVSLHALKSAIYIVCAYELNADIDEILEMREEEIFDINDDLLDKYQHFLNLVTDGDIMISGDAKTEMLAAINLYFEASAFIRNETDDQTDDLLQLDDDSDHDETEFQEDLFKIEQSINETIPVTLGEVETVNAGEIFNDPIDIRSYLPELATDPYTHDILIVSESSFPDRTFSGILPENWPTKGDVYIDKVRVLGMKSEYFYPSYLGLCINGLASWDIKEIMVSGPGFWPVTFSPIQILSDILSNDQLYVQLIEQSYNGEYHFSVTDNDGNTYGQTRHFTRNNIYVPSQSVLPDNNSFIGTTSPTIVLPALPQSNVPLYYNISIWEPFNYQSGRKLIYRTITSNNQWTVPENILLENQLYSWDAFVQDAPNIDVANNVQGILQHRLFHTGADGTVTIKKGNIQSRQSSEGIETLIDLDTIGWTYDTPINISGPMNQTMRKTEVPYAEERAYTINSGIIPDGTYSFTLNKAGMTATYTLDYTFQSIPVAQNLTLSC